MPATINITDAAEDPQTGNVIVSYELQGGSFDTSGTVTATINSATDGNAVADRALDESVGAGETLESGVTFIPDDFFAEKPNEAFAEVSYAVPGSGIVSEDESSTFTIQDADFEDDVEVTGCNISIGEGGFSDFISVDFVVAHPFGSQQFIEWDILFDGTVIESGTDGIADGETMSVSLDVDDLPLGTSVVEVVVSHTDSNVASSLVCGTVEIEPDDPDPPDNGDNGDDPPDQEPTPDLIDIDCSLDATEIDPGGSVAVTATITSSHEIDTTVVWEVLVNGTPVTIDGSADISTPVSPFGAETEAVVLSFDEPGDYDIGTSVVTVTN